MIHIIINIEQLFVKYIIFILIADHFNNNIIVYISEYIYLLLLRSSTRDFKKVTRIFV